MIDWAFRPGSIRRIFVALLCLVASFSPMSAAEDEPSVGTIFRKDYGTTQAKVKQTGVPAMIIVMPRKGEPFEPLADPRVLEKAKWFLSVTVQPITKMAKALNSSEATVMAFLDEQGEVLARIGPKDTSMSVLKQMKELAKKSRTDFLTKLKCDETSEADAKINAESLIRMGGSPAEILPLAVHKSAAVKAAVTKAIPTLPPDDVALAALDGLASEDVEMRTACYKWANAAVKIPKTPALKFWREASETERKEALTKWREAAMIDMGPLNQAILEFAEVNYGKKVNNGQCAMLASDAFDAVGAKRMTPKDNTYVWGREVTTGQKVLPGDVVQLENCKFGGGGSAPHHTQIIRKVLGPGKYEILEQNSNGRLTVGSAQLDMNKLTQGTVKIYRPQLPE